MVDDDGDTEYSLARPPTPTMVHRQSTPLSPPFTMHGRDSWRQGTPSESPFPTPAQPQVRITRIASRARAYSWRATC